MKDSKNEMAESFCVYMDILGFQEMIQTSFKENKQNLLFEEFHKAINSTLDPLKNGPKSLPPPNLKIFTDNIVLGLKLDPKGDWAPEFSSLVAWIAFFQIMMSQSAFFIRGGFSKGNLFMDETIVYGDALVEAVKIERNISSDARVVVSLNVAEKMKTVRDAVLTNPYILKDADGQFFVNYLQAIVSKKNPARWNLLQGHKEVIEKNLEKYSNSSRVWNKYHWLANYHNFFCLAKASLDGYQQSFMVNESLLKRYPKAL